MGNLLSFLLGGFFGGFIGMSFTCLCIAAKKADKDIIGRDA